MKLRDYQTDAIGKLRDAYRAGAKCPLFVCSTGSGKTVILAEIAKSLQERGTSACIVVHRQELVDQTAKALGRAGVMYGIISPHYKPRPDTTIQIASISTLIRRLEKYNFGFLLLDEAHHAAAGTWDKVIRAYPQAKLLGVTATPCRLDGAPLDKVFDAMIEGPSISELIERGFLTQAKIFAPPSGIDFKSMHLRGGDFDADEMEAQVSKTAVMGSAVDHYRKHCDGQPAIVFCVSVNHAVSVATAFREAGYRAESVNGNDTQHHRKTAIAGLGNGSVQVLTSCSIISEGTDIPRATCAILLRPTMSLSFYLQMVGRVLRPVYADRMPIDTDEERLAAIAAGEKPFAVILDHCGNVARHGVHHEEREWSLTERQKKPRKAAEMPPGMRVCPKCDAVVRVRVGDTQCPECGFTWPIPKGRKIVQIDGELVEVIEEPEKTGEARVYQQLKEIATFKGYKPGWAFFIRQQRRDNSHYEPIDTEIAKQLEWKELVRYVTGKLPKRDAA